MARKNVTGIVTSTLQITGGSPAVGKIPVSNATGVMTPTAFPTVTVNHGSTASTARPVQITEQPVTWIGSVEPTNALNGDIWIDIS